MLLRILPILVLSLIAISSSSSNSKESYTETLTIQPLLDGKVNSNFNFIMKGPITSESDIKNIEGDNNNNIKAHHHTLLPPSLTSILTLYSVTSFHLTLSSGRYASHWPLYSPSSSSSNSSSNPYHSIPSTPSSGIELYAFLKILPPSSSSTTDPLEEERNERKRWEGFLGALGGMFCAGIDGGRVNEDSPQWGYQFDGRVGTRDQNHLYRTLQPRLSATCTESLTPFLLLLPCISQAGISSLLNPHTLFDGDWTLLGVHYTEEEFEGEGRGRGVVRLEVGSVGDPVRRERKQGGVSKRDFSLSKLYDRKLKKSCPVASQSEIKLIIPQDSTAPFEILPSEGMYLQREEKDILGRDREFAVWDSRFVSEENPLDISMTWNGESQFHPPKIDQIISSPISTRRLLSGYGQERGKIGIEVINYNLLKEVEVIWIETWPWWFRAFIGSLKVVPDMSSSSSGVEGSIKPLAKILSLDYTPSIARKRPTTLQVLISLPANSTNRFEIDFELAYLWYTEYRSDAHRGFEIPGGVLILLEDFNTVSSSSLASTSEEGEEEEEHILIEDRKHLYKIHTPSTLLSIPTPDFSMPYNVIILTCTAMALFFGSVMNVFVRSWLVVDLDGEDEVEEGEKGEEKEIEKEEEEDEDVEVE